MSKSNARRSIPVASIYFGADTFQVAAWSEREESFLVGEEDYRVPESLSCHYSIRGVLWNDQICNAARNNNTKDSTGFCNIRQYLGRAYDDPSLKFHKRKGKANVSKGYGGMVTLYPKNCECETGQRPFYPQEILAVILSDLKAKSEEIAKDAVPDVVITIPAYFNWYQRLATEEAALIAGFTHMNFVYEPLAVAGIYESEGVWHSALVFQLSKSALDVAIVHRKSTGELELQGTGGGGCNVGAHNILKPLADSENDPEGKRKAQDAADEIFKAFAEFLSREKVDAQEIDLVIVAGIECPTAEFPRRLSDRLPRAEIKEYYSVDKICLGAIRAEFIVGIVTSVKEHCRTPPNVDLMRIAAKLPRGFLEDMLYQSRITFSVPKSIKQISPKIWSRVNPAEKSTTKVDQLGGDSTDRLKEYKLANTAVVRFMI